MQQPLGRIATFYSYKGGTGRSMALANFAWIVAASGKRVLAIDWDLEAPGLHRYFRPFLVDPDLFESDGLIDTFWSFAASAVEKSSSDAKRPASKDRANVEEGLVDATRRLDWKFPTGGYIDFIGAGRQDETYSQRVNTFDWKRFYDLGGSRVLNNAKEHLRKRYDWVLIDSRTGVSDTSGISTIQMPDTVVAFFTLNRQSIDGVTAILRAIKSARKDNSPISFFPVATRIENAESERLELARSYARNALSDFVPTAMQSSPRDYWDKMEIAYRPAYAFEEVLAAFGDATGSAGAADTMLSQVEATAQRITGDETLSMPEIVETDRLRVLAKYAFGGSPPSAKRRLPVVENVADTDFLRRVRAKEQLWRSSQFQWRRLLSRRELDLLTDEDKKGFGRNMAYYLSQSERMQRVLRLTDTGGPVSLLVAIVAVVVFFIIFFSREMSLNYLFSSRMMLWRMGTVSLAMWISFAFVWSAVAFRDKPYGLKRSQVFILMLLGPFRIDIRDYDPNEKVIPSRPSKSAVP